MSGSDTADHPARRQDVDGGELLGRPQGVAEGGHVDVGEEADLAGHRSQVAEGGDGVVPGVAHGSGQSVRDERVVAHTDVEEARRFAGLGHLGQLGWPGIGFPRFDVDRGLRLHGQLHAERHDPGRQHGDDVDGESDGGVGHGENLTASGP